MPQVENFMDTAAIISNLDLVITVDTSIAHISGAIGKPTWLLNRFDGNFRWLLNWNNSFWYPTMKIISQPSTGDWTTVINQVREGLL